MKKIFMIVFIVITANAGGIWDTMTNSSSVGTIKTREYIIFKASGWNSKGYIMNIPEMKSICFLTYGTQGMFMVCKTYKEMGK